LPCSPIKGETLVDYWDYTHRIFEWPDNGYSNMILDDGGDATLLLHLGSRAEKDISVLANPGSRGRAHPVRRDQGQARGRQDLVLDAPGADQGRHRGNHHRRASPVPDARARRTEDPRDQRQ
jgi:hypothetical protein